LCELDSTTLRRAGTVVGDDPDQLLSESGDIISALQTGELTSARIISLATLRADAQLLRAEPSRDLLVFKSVGTTLQDLALSRALYCAARTQGYADSITEIADITRRKPFTASQ
jgi:alanine dehydrogenase